MQKAPIRDYRDLIAWQKAMDLAVACEKVCVELPARASSLVTQIRRAAVSIPANIAEGNGRFSRPDYLKHLSIANGSVRELESHLEFAKRAYGRTEAIEASLKLALEVCKLLAGLVRALRGKKKPQ
ncbi:MAG: four helix bundle protein [Gemmatimonadaceae bacterium]